MKIPTTAMMEKIRTGAFAKGQMHRLAPEIASQSSDHLPDRAHIPVTD